jgi:hypothetical protein
VATVPVPRPVVPGPALKRRPVGTIPVKQFQEWGWESGKKENGGGGGLKCDIFDTL